MKKSGKNNQKKDNKESDLPLIEGDHEEVKANNELTSSWLSSREKVEKKSTKPRRKSVKQVKDTTHKKEEDDGKKVANDGKVEDSNNLNGADEKIMKDGNETHQKTKSDKRYPELNESWFDKNAALYRPWAARSKKRSQYIICNFCKDKYRKYPKIRSREN